jgi:histidine triad (HIT) family protein
MDGCLFCTIVAGESPAEIVARTDDIVAFRDKFPRAPVHILVVPVRHISSAHDLGPEDTALLAACFALARRIAEDEGISDGYRVTTNVGEKGGQAIGHLHFHVIGGRQLGHIDSGDTV